MSLITIQNCITQSITAVRASTAISTYCTTNYSATLKIFNGLIDSARIEQADAPFCIFQPPLHPYDLGTAADLREPGMLVQWAIYKETLYVPDTPANCKAVTFSDSDNTITFDGQKECCELGFLIATAIQDAWEGVRGWRFAEAMMTLDDSGPLWGGAMNIKLVNETGMASEPT